VNRGGVAITGLGAITPLGLSVPAFWAAALRGESGAGPIARFDASAFDTRFACELKGFDPTNYMDRKMARRLDPFAQYALAAANEAIADAGLASETMPEAMRARIGVIVGSGQGGMQTFQNQADVYRASGPGRLSPFFVPMLIPNMAGSVIAMEHGFYGPNHCVVSACATGNDSIMSALDTIRAGRADIVIAGGCEACITELGLGGFGAARALSTRNDAPLAASRPLDTARDGFVIGEGAAVLVLESWESAEARGARVYAELRGVGASNDAYHMTAPRPDGMGAMLSMRAALAEGHVEPMDVDTINLHATSTPLGDAAEIAAVRAVFGAHADQLTATATKSMTGHMLGAAGAAEAVLSVLSIVHSIVPPTINLDTLDPACCLSVARNAAVSRPIAVALSNSFGFGGHNTSALFAATQ